MNRYLFRAGAVAGVASIAVFAAGPAMAAGTVSQATAQSLDVSIAGQTGISQLVTASNDGKTETTNNADTLPKIASVTPGTNVVGAGVAPQKAGANADGTSYACAGIAGTGGGIAQDGGDRGCNINGKPLSLDLGNISLGNALLGQDSALGSALANIPGLTQVEQTLVNTVLNPLLGQITTQLKATPLGQISVGGSLSAIAGICAADPNSASGTANIADSSGGKNNTPIGVTIPDGSGGTKTLALVNLPANPKPNTHVLTNLDSVTQTVIDAVKQELTTAAGGALASAAGPLGNLLQTVQDQLVKTLVAGLQPVLKPLQENVLDITLNKQVSSDSGKKIDVTALDGNILPLGGMLPGGNGLVSLKIGHVTCGPNAKVAAPPSESPTPTPTATPTTPGGNVPTNVDSGLAGNSSHANEIIAGVAALLALTGVGGAAAYRRFGMPRG